MKKTMINMMLVLCMIFGLTGCGINIETNASETNTSETTEMSSYEAGVMNNTLVTYDSDSLIVGEEYLIKDVYRYEYNIRLYLEKDENRHMIVFKFPNSGLSESTLFETGYSIGTLSAFYPGDYVKYLGNDQFEWIPKYDGE